MFGALGYAQTGAQIWDYGPPGWAFQLFGFLLFVGVVTYLIYEWDERMQALPEPGSTPHKDRDRDRKLALIKNARGLAATYTQGYGGPFFRKFLEKTETYAALRGHLSQEYLAKLNAPRTAYASDGSGEYEPLVEWVLDDLDRLEKEWKLA